ncbi:carbohydrate ABC transporter permease [Paenibacillus thalictri]|uniref:Carbohydrate ABC transporter permease n=1 Tax=Paenibacillus thalictri TaxID=2527873 RepID=A0A4Q9DIT3_9BACL|nr:carbohydrate ABC transporter permease [Paenibacillus thalictri]TBL73284.1 carbohydrate ABC transporter permease [Paenibacillus thalictri]
MKPLAGQISRQAALIAYVLIVLLPFTVMFFATFKSMAGLFQDPFGIPKSFAPSNYIELFRKEDMLVYFKNSGVVTFASVCFILFFSSMVAYGITRMPGRKAALLFALFSLGMTIPSQTSIIPLYILMSKLGLTNSQFGLILVETAFIIPIGVFILTGFMKTIPQELIEAAQMDGANEWYIYQRIAMPISLPSVATLAIFALMIVWNNLLLPLLLLKSKSVKTLPLKLLEFKGEYLTNYPQLFAAVVVISIPMIIMYVFLQRYFIEGVTAGSVKG